MGRQRGPVLEWWELRLGQAPRRCPELLSCSPKPPRGEEEGCCWKATLSSALVLLNKVDSLLFHKENQKNYGNFAQKNA